MNNKSLVCAASCLPLAVLCNYAAATDVLRMEGFGPVSRAMGGTAMSYDVGNAGMMSNPATLSLQSAGSHFSIGADVVTTDIKTRNQDTGETANSHDKSNNRGPYYAPELSYSYRADRWAVGIGAFAQGGLGTEYGKDSFLSNGVSGAPTGLDNSSRLLVLNIPLAFSFDINDQLTVGASVDAMWMGMNINMMFGANQVGSLIGSGRSTGSLVPVIGSLPALDGAHIGFSKDQPLASGADAWGIGGRIGLLWKATETTHVGVAYNFKSQMADLKGNATVTAVDRIAGQIPINGKIEVRDFQMPASLSIGVSHAITDRWLVTADVSRVFWRDAMKDIKVNFVDSQGQDLNLQFPQTYRDQTIGALGTSYRIGNWTLRAGYRQGTKAAQGSQLFATLPVTPTKHITTGFSYQVSASSRVDFAYDHALQETTYNSVLPNTAVPIKNTHSQDNFVLGYTYDF
ncbi:outer membrane protein transport protein [Pseudomonas sp. KK18]|uniref:OmpP1/FadL family transporter n=1 Tax=Pseudomonas sp. KK18 TaxID=3123039 RepID=UPI0030D5AA72